jgi:hypothetical protein
MAADPGSLALTTPWRKSTRSGSGGCVEAALAQVVNSRPVLMAPAANQVNSSASSGA